VCGALAAGFCATPSELWGAMGDECPGPRRPWAMVCKAFSLDCLADAAGWKAVGGRQQGGIKHGDTEDRSSSLRTQA
jgi:hypothetical protein